MLAPPETIHVGIEGTLPMIFNDHIRITQVFQNLLDNAIKFMDKSQGEILVRCDDDGSHWIFRVTDNGPGIEERHQERIFQIFQTLHPRDEFESTGIGLALVKKMVELSGGEIWVESISEKGSTFSFRLPKIPKHEKYVME
jgi:signal transduction histidine kinase